MTAKLTLTSGLPASGKSTWAEAQVTANPEITVRVNKDDIRTELFGWEYHSGNFNNADERLVSAVERERVQQALSDGKHVVSDNTYLSPKTVRKMALLAKEHNAKIDVVSFNVPLDECKRRNTARGAAGGRKVPDFVMDGMAEKAYDSDGNLKQYVFHDDKETTVEFLPAKEIAARNLGVDTVPLKDTAEKNA